MLLFKFILIFIFVGSGVSQVVPCDTINTIKTYSHRSKKCNDFSQNHSVLLFGVKLNIDSIFFQNSKRKPKLDHTLNQGRNLPPSEEKTKVRLTYFRYSNTIDLKLASHFISYPSFLLLAKKSFHNGTKNIGSPLFNVAQQLTGQPESL